MKKKALLLVLLMLIIAGVVFAQADAKNTAAVQITFLGVAGSYERMFTPHFSLLAEAAFTTLGIADEFTASGKARWYPFGKAFYLEMGLGLAYGHSFSNFIGNFLLGVITFGWWFTTDEFNATINKRTGGFLLQPGLGWKIDIGQPGGLVLPIGMGLDIKVSAPPDILPYFRIGLGYSF